jgi:hypothetical protein
MVFDGLYVWDTSWVYIPCHHFEKLDELMVTKFISPIDVELWLSSIVTILKNNGSLCDCVNFRKPNIAIRTCHYPLHDMEEIVDEIVGHEMYFFIDLFLTILPSSHGHGRQVKNCIDNLVGPIPIQTTALWGHECANDVFNVLWK